MATTASNQNTDAEETPQSESKEAPALDKTLEELILNKSSGKYQVVELISFRAKYLRQQEDFRHLTQTEVLELAMREVLSGELDENELTKQMLAAPPSTNGKKDADKLAKKK